jgi:hypothetical protein
VIPGRGLAFPRAEPEGPAGSPPANCSGVSFGASLEQPIAGFVRPRRATSKASHGSGSGGGADTPRNLVGAAPWRRPAGGIALAREDSVLGIVRKLYEDVVQVATYF